MTGTVLYYSDAAGMHRLLKLENDTIIDIEYGLSPAFQGMVRCGGLVEISHREWLAKKSVALYTTDDIENALMSR